MILSQQVTVTTAGTAVQADSADERVLWWWLRAHQSNTGENIYVGNDGDGDVASTTGLCLNKADAPICIKCRLKDLWVDADTSGDKLTVMVALN